MRGLAVFVGRHVTTPERADGPASSPRRAPADRERAIVLLQVAVLAVAAGAAWGTVPGVVLGLVLGGVALVRRPRLGDPVRPGRG